MSCVFAFPYAVISLEEACDWDAVEERKYFFSVQVLFVIPMEKLQLVKKIHFVQGGVVESLHITRITVFI